MMDLTLGICSVKTRCRTWMLQRMQICEAVRPYFCASSRMTGWSSACPLARGQYPPNATPSLRQNSTSCHGCWNGWNSTCKNIKHFVGSHHSKDTRVKRPPVYPTSTWLTWGITLESSFISSRCLIRKLLTPMERHNPVTTGKHSRQRRNRATTRHPFTYKSTPSSYISSRALHVSARTSLLERPGTPQSGQCIR